MKQIKLAAIFIIVLLLAGCSNSPKNVALKFLKAVGERDYNTAVNYVSADSKEFLNLMKDDFNKMTPAERQNNSWIYQITNVTIENNRATVDYDKIPDTSGNGTEDDAIQSSGKLKMVNSNDNWKVELQVDSGF